MKDNSNSIKNEEYIKDLNSDISSNIKHNKHTKKHSISRNKTLSLCSIVLILCAIFLIIFFTTCNKKKNNITPTPPEPDTSWISYLDDNNETIKVDMPYCEENVDALCDFNEVCTVFFINSSTSVTIDKSKLNGIHFGSEWDEMTEAPDFFCTKLFGYIATSYPILEINFPSKINSVGNHFCAYMFTPNLSLLPSFCLPQLITDVGDNFCYAMFETTSITSLPSGFCLPPGIKNVGTSFCAYMFDECSNIETLPTSFNLKLDSLSSNGDCFCECMFQGAGALKPSTAGQTNNLILPSNLQAGTNRNYGNMFHNCTLLNAAGVADTPTPGSSIGIQRNH